MVLKRYSAVLATRRKTKIFGKNGMFSDLFENYPFSKKKPGRARPGAGDHIISSGVVEFLVRPIQRKSFAHVVDPKTALEERRSH